MKLWLISQSKNQNSWDVFDSAVVAAETEEEAKMMRPLNGAALCQGDVTWVERPEDVECEYLGEAEVGTQKQVICSSYNPG